MYRALRILRIVVSVIMLVATVAGAVLTGPLATALAHATRTMQVSTAIITVSGVWIVFWLAITLLFGRIFCSTACPMGTILDIAARLRIMVRPKHYSYTTPITALRVVMAIVFVEGVILGSVAISTWLNPYTDVIEMLTVWGSASVGVMAAAATVAFIVLVSAWRSGRVLCNTLCPVGALLGGVSAVSLTRFDINPDVCTHCGKCEDACKSSCIDSTRSLVDPTRCVVCFDCTAVCPDGAITWRTGRHRLQWPLLQRTTSAPSACAKTEKQLSNETISRPPSAHS